MTQWKYQYRAFAEQEPKEVRDSLAASGMPKRDLVGRRLGSVDDLVRHASRKKDVIVTDVRKKSAKYEQSDLEVEVTEVGISGRNVHTVCVASNDVPKIHDALQRFGVLRWPGA